MSDFVLDRREFLHKSLLAAAVAGAPLGLPRAARAAADPLRELDAMGMARAVRKGELQALELVEASAAAIEQLDPRINAVVTRFFDHARELAADVDRTKPFAGVPYLIKDLSDYAGFRTAFGSKVFEQNISQSTEPVVEAALRGGLIPLGKSSTPEYGALPTTEPLAFGPTRNPWNLEYSSGGSSGGSGAAVAAGMVPVALSSDGGGSIRIPACNCGVFGLKVSRGRNQGASNEPLYLGVRGAISRSVRDSAAHLAVTQQVGDGATLPSLQFISGPAKRRLKIGLVLKGVGDVEPSAEVREAVLDAAKLCEELGHTLVETRLPDSVRDMGDRLMDYTSDRIARMGQGVAERLGRPLEELGFEPWLLQQIAHRATVSQERFDAAREHLLRQAAETRAMFEQFDVLLMPVLGTRAVKLGTLRSAPEISFEEMLRRNQGYVAYTTVFNVSGDPAMSVPLHWTDDGIPIGSHFAAGLGQEQTLLELAYELEAARPWRDRHPPVSVWAAA